MTAEEMIKVLQALPPKQRVGFEISKYQVKNGLDYFQHCEKEEQSVLLDIDGYERSSIGDKDDELFFFSLNICEI